jgi:hypothetical protein
MAKIDLTESGDKVVKEVQDQAISRGIQASNEIRNAALNVLRGQRSGRRYRIPHTGKPGVKGSGTYYSASKPGEAPAVRTGNLRSSWQTRPTVTQSGDTVTVSPGIRSNVPYNKYLDDHFGSGARRKIAERPYVDSIKERAMPGVTRIYKRKYL